MKYYFGEYPPKMRWILATLGLRVLDCCGHSFPYKYWCRDCLRKEARIGELESRWHVLAVGESYWADKRIQALKTQFRRRYVGLVGDKWYVDLTPIPKFEPGDSTRYRPGDGKTPPDSGGMDLIG